MKKYVLWFPVLCLLLLLGGCSAGETSAESDRSSIADGSQSHMAIHEVLTIGDTPVVLDGKVVSFSGDGWRYDVDSATLTMDSLFISRCVENEDGFSALYCSGDLNILLSGESTIDISASHSDVSSSAVYVLGQLTISGTGKLNVKGASAAEDSVGIYALRGLTISGADVTASGGTGSRSMGVVCGSGLWLEKDGALQASGGTAKQFSAGVYTGQGLVSVQNAVMTANGGAITGENGSDLTDDARSCGIWSASQVSIHAGDVTAAGGEADAGENFDVFSDGIYAVGSVEIDASSRVAVNGGNARGGEAYSRGICCFSGNVEVHDGVLNGYGGSVTGSRLAVSCGAYVENGGFYAYEDGVEVTLAGGSAEVSLETGKAYANGIHAAAGDVGLGAGNAAVIGGRITGGSGNAESIVSVPPAA